MRQPRLRGEGTYFVHTISRIVDRRFIFEDNEKEHFCQLLRRLSGFTGLDVVTFCVMGNHIHLLIEQPDQATLPALTKAELLRRARFLYDANTIKDLEQEFQRAEEAGDQPWIQRILDRYAHRMGDVSKLIASLPQTANTLANAAPAEPGKCVAGIGESCGCFVICRVNESGIKQEGGPVYPIH